MTTNLALVWMDSAEAHVLSFDRDHLESRTVRARTHHKHQGKKGPEVQFFPAISAALAGSHHVLLTGPGGMRDTFRTWVDRHHPAASKLIVQSVPTERPTEAQLVGLARKYFERAVAAPEPPVAP